MGVKAERRARAEQKKEAYKKQILDELLDVCSKDEVSSNFISMHMTEFVKNMLKQKPQESHLILTAKSLLINQIEQTIEEAKKKDKERGTRKTFEYVCNSCGAEDIDTKEMKQIPHRDRTLHACKNCADVPVEQFKAIDKYDKLVGDVGKAESIEEKKENGTGKQESGTAEAGQ